MPKVVDLSFADHCLFGNGFVFVVLAGVAEPFEHSIRNSYAYFADDLVYWWWA